MRKLNLADIRGQDSRQAVLSFFTRSFYNGENMYEVAITY